MIASDRNGRSRMRNCWNERFETMPLAELQRFQLDHLRKTVRRTYEKVPFYRNKFDAIGIKPKDVKKLNDLARLPFTVKTDLRDQYPSGFLAVPMNRVSKIHASSGTTGKPVVNFYTAKDIDQWAECVARKMVGGGIGSDDIFQIAYGMGLFTGGLGYYHGCLKLGTMIIPASSGQTERQIMLMKDFHTTAIGSTPSYALTIAERAQEMGIDLTKLPLRVGIMGAEPWSDEMRKEIELKMGIKAMDTYGLTELCGPGVAYECQDQDGMHINEDHFIPEIIDPPTGEVLPLGTVGELVLTSIQREAMPMIRYRTRDITSLRREECPCGRTLIKMDRVQGRTDDMLIISGVNVFPSQIENLLLDFTEIEPQYAIFVRKKGYLVALHVDVEAKPQAYEDESQKMTDLENRISNHLREMIGIGIGVRVVPPKSIARSEGKVKRVIDERAK
jgi:phenylacetate-CoA ligase